jgi:excinuclease ABC B subunit
MTVMSEFHVSDAYTPTGDQPRAIESLTRSLKAGDSYQTLLGATGTGKTATMAWIIEQVQKPTLVIAHNKTLAAQLCNEFREFLPGNAVEYFVSYYDYYQPEAYVPQADLYIEKDASINDDIDRLRHAATAALLARKDVVIVASVSCIYGIGSPIEYEDKTVVLGVGIEIDRDVMLRKLVDIQYSRNDSFLGRGRFRVRGDVVEVQPAHMESAYRISLFGDEVEQITHFDPLSGEIYARLEHLAIFPATQYVTSKDTIERSVGEIRHELEEQVKLFESQGKLLEAHRIRQRTEYDLEMLQELGYCNGIENYSRIPTAARQEPPRTPFSTTSEATSWSWWTSRIRPCHRSAACTRATARARRRWSTSASGSLRRSTTGRSASTSSSRTCRNSSSSRQHRGRSSCATRRTSPSRSSVRPGSSTPRSSCGRPRTRSTTCSTRFGGARRRASESSSRR